VVRAVSYENPAERVPGSVDSWNLVRIERRRLARLSAQADRRERKRARIVRVLELFHLSRGKFSRVSAAPCLVDSAQQP
jgi:hypothetical protein